MTRITSTPYSRLGVIHFHGILSAACLLAGVLSADWSMAGPDRAAPAAKMYVGVETPVALPLKPAYLNQFADVGPVDVERIAAVGETSKTAPADEKSAEQKSAEEKPAAPPAVEKPKRELSPALVALRDQVRRVLAQHQKQAFNTRDNSPTEIMNFCRAFGCATEVSLEGPGGRKLNGITSLCWNYPCAGFEMIGPGEGHLVARIGYGYQENPGELLAVLAMSRVPPTYPIRSGKTTSTVADLVESEERSCRTGSDLSLKLIGLSYYVEEPTWKNDRDEEWSIERMIQQELGKPVVSAADGGLNRLMGLSFATLRRAKRGEPIDGQYQRAKKYVSDFHEFALALQNTDGTWGPYLLTARSASQDAGVQLRSTGRVLEWLALSLPDEKLEDARVVRAVECVARLLSVQRYMANVPALTTREIGAVGQAVHALAMYDERVFKPADSAEKPAEEKAKPVAASRAAKPTR